jgi:hypothetical protein
MKKETVMRSSHLLLPLLATVVAAAPAHTETAVPTASFQAVELRGGGKVTVRHGPQRRVTVHKGSAQISAILSDGRRLVIDKCRSKCPRGYRVEVEVVTPEIAALAVTDGGVVQAEGGFPAQAAVEASVSSGGAVDIRSLDAARVVASVRHGGRIFARPGRAMDASVSDGGMIAYWGDPAVRSSVRRGGGVVRGAAADLRRSLAQFDPPLPPLPAVPPLPQPPRLRKH